jgi:hypothetical protein
MSRRSRHVICVIRRNGCPARRLSLAGAGCLAWKRERLRVHNAPNELHTGPSLDRYLQWKGDILRLLVAISGHGFGHLSQVAPVVNALAEVCPGLELTVRSALARSLLRARIRPPFEHQQVADDVGLVQRSAFDVDLEASAEAYRHFHSRWEVRVRDTASELQALAPDLVLADVPYLTLAAAARAGIPSVGLCSLNWADIYAHFFGRDTVHRQISQAYRTASVFLRPQPSMPMPELGRTLAIPPVAEPGRRRRGEIDRVLGLNADERLVLVALGGIRARLPIERWPRLPGVRWLVPGDWSVRHPDAVPRELLEMPFGDVLASSDLLVTKPGYGSFVEAAACGLPVAYIPRSDWPEQTYLIRWIEQRGRAAALEPSAVEGGEIAKVVGRLLQGDRPRPVAATGAHRAVAELLRFAADRGAST